MGYHFPKRVKSFFSKTVFNSSPIAFCPDQKNFVSNQVPGGIATVFSEKAFIITSIFPRQHRKSYEYISQRAEELGLAACVHWHHIFRKFPFKYYPSNKF